MEATRQAFTPDSITITRREGGGWDAVAVVTSPDGTTGTVKFILVNAAFTLEAHWAPSRSYIYDLISETEPPTVVAYEFGMHSFIAPVTEPDGRNIFLWMQTVNGGCDAS